MRFKTAVAPMAMVGGAYSDRPSGILVDEQSARSVQGRRRGNLYVLVEVAGRAAGRESVSRQLLDIVRATYADWRGTVTAGLQQAVREANNWLVDENRVSLPGELYTAGISCAVLRENDLFIAQAGPAALFLMHEGQVTRFPDLSPWLDNLPDEEAEGAPLGTRHDVDVTLFHETVDAGDLTLLVNSGLASRLSPERWHQIQASPTTEGVRGAVLAAGKGADLLALIVGLGEAAEEPAAEPASGRMVPPRGAAERVPASARPAVGRDRFQPGPRLEAMLRVVGTALAGFGAALLSLLKRLVPGKVNSAPTRRTTTVRAEREAGEPRRGPASGPARNRLFQRLAIVVAILLPLVVGIVVLSGHVRRTREEKAEIEALWQKADTSWQLADRAREPSAIRGYLAEARQAVEEFLQRRPDDAPALALRKQIDAREDEVNQVRRISWIQALKTYPAGASLTRVVVEGEHVFVMDRGGGRVYHHQLDSFRQSLEPSTADTLVVSKGDQVGAVLVSDLVDMAWVPVGSGRQKAALVILESGSALLEYDPATKDLAPLAVADTSSWSFPKLVGSYFGRFYLLDINANKIWRYFPSSDGYSTAPDDWLQAEVDLLGVVDMSIGDDIYLLYGDGKIRRLAGGEPGPFGLADWDTPLKQPSALFARPPDIAQWIYVADRGNSRIVECNPDGKFRRQFRLSDPGSAGGSDPLAGVTSLFVDEIDGRAFFLSGQKLFVAVLPQ